MSARRYRVSKNMYPQAAMYALTALAELADGRTYPAEVATPAARQWAQQVFDQMLAEGYIEPRDEEQS